MDLFGATGLFEELTSSETDKSKVLPMFGALFDDEGDAGSSAATTTCGVERPPLARDLKTQLCGIANQGATCYLNSLLQTLFFTPEFRGALEEAGQRYRLVLFNVGQISSSIFVITCTVSVVAECLFRLSPEELGENSGNQV